MSKTEGFLILNSQDAATTGGNFRDHFHFEYLFRALNCVIEFKFRIRTAATLPSSLWFCVDAIVC